jgi:hypothetical protein
MSTARTASTRTAPASVRVTPTLDGAALSPATLLLVASGVFGSLLFMGVYLVEGATRPGYSTLHQAISALSLGAGGWMQQANFIVFGLISLCAALGWRRALVSGAGALAYPILRVIEAIGLIGDGFFSQDPAPGYPAGGSAPATPTLTGILHNSFAVAAITAVALSAYVLAWRFVHEPRWRAWALPTLITGVLMMVFIAIFGAVNMQPDSLAGLYERLSTAVSTVLSLAILARLLLDRRATHAAA